MSLKDHEAQTKKIHLGAQDLVAKAVVDGDSACIINRRGRTIVVRRYIGTSLIEEFPVDPRPRKPHGKDKKVS